MLKKSIFLATSAMLFAAADAATSTIADAGSVAPEAAKKSIVPSKYSGKYKNGGSDALATFIKAQCGEGDKFEFTAFFALCEKNGLAADKIAHYKAMVDNKEHGAEGRARMTLRNMLATPARKNGKLVGLDGAEHEVVIAKAVLTGAAAAAQATAAEKSTSDEQATETAGENSEVAETAAEEDATTE
jgi:hypothetical protein